MLSIGGNHLLHALRRNVDIKILCFDNRIYGLTKGQASPTSETGKITGSTPMGSLDRPVNPISVAMAAEATFVARTADVFGKHLQDVMLAAADHQGSAFVQILQNCVIFNDGAFTHVTDRANREEKVLYLEHGQPMVFGKNKDKGLRFNGSVPEIVPAAEAMPHDARDEALGYMLSRVGAPNFPTPVGIFHRVDDLQSLEKGVHAQIEEARRKQEGDIMSLIHAGDVWEVS
jgi:2-oxoglutarate ferredoxin oxidoreductase subunit beta